MAELPPVRGRTRAARARPLLAGAGAAGPPTAAAGDGRARHSATYQAGHWADVADHLSRTVCVHALSRLAGRDAQVVCILSHMLQEYFDYIELLVSWKLSAEEVWLGVI